jgi:hypothetical protein
MTCAHCGTTIADKALICYRCGRPTQEPRVAPPPDSSLFERPRRRKWPVVVLAVAVAVAVVAWILML